MDVLVYSALNEQASLKKQVADEQKELFGDLLVANLLFLKFIEFVKSFGKAYIK